MSVAPDPEIKPNFGENAFQTFLNDVLPEALISLADPTMGVDLHCKIVPPGKPGRRLLVESDPGEGQVRVIVEATYEVFEGDTHYHVQRIGAVDRTKAGEELEPLLKKAFANISTWNPNHDSVWEDVTEY